MIYSYAKDSAFAAVMQCVLGMRKGYHLLIKGMKGVPFLSNMTAANIILIILLYFSFYQMTVISESIV